MKYFLLLILVGSAVLASAQNTDNRQTLQMANGRYWYDLSQNYCGGASLELAEKLEWLSGYQSGITAAFIALHGADAKLVESFLPLGIENGQIMAALNRFYSDTPENAAFRYPTPCRSSLSEPRAAHPPR